MILTRVRRCHDARLLHRIQQAHHWPTIRIGRCPSTSPVTWWRSARPPTENPKPGKESTNADGIGRYPARTRNKEPTRPLASTSLASVPRDRRCTSSTWNSPTGRNLQRHPLSARPARTFGKPRNGDRAAHRSAGTVAHATVIRRSASRSVNRTVNEAHRNSPGQGDAQGAEATTERASQPPTAVSSSRRS
jgi:hypothetical protein